MRKVHAHVTIRLMTGSLVASPFALAPALAQAQGSRLVDAADEPEQLHRVDDVRVGRVLDYGRRPQRE